MIVHREVLLIDFHKSRGYDEIARKDIVDPHGYMYYTSPSIDLEHIVSKCQYFFKHITDSSLIL